MLREGVFHVVGLQKGALDKAVNLKCLDVIANNLSPFHMKNDDPQGKIP
jgi:hypothetical protein